MLTFLAVLSASADDPAPHLDALITVSVTPIIQHPLIEVEPQTDSVEFRQVLQERQGQLVYCFEKSLKSNPNLSGSLTVVLDLEAGVVQSVVSTGDTIGEEISSCVTQKMRSWRYPASLSGQFTLPFTCGAGAEAP
ncbi:MAG: hypothetical protein ACI8RZ_002810 [Myxococcota bacterium]|jgi:hypothetical protein